MVRLLSWPLALVLVAGYLLGPAALPGRASSGRTGQPATGLIVAPRLAPPTPAPTQAQPTEPAPTPSPTAPPSPSPAATPRPAPTPTPAGTPKPTIPPKPSPSPGVMPAPVQADIFARVVNGPSVVLRQAPTSNSARVARVPKGQIVGITGATGKWYQASFRGKVGYAPKGRLQLIGLIGKGLSQQHARVIVVDRRQQHIEVYQDGQLMIITAVTTGRPELPTPLGMFRVMGLESPHLFRSPWPETSQFWYPPGWADYSVLFRSGGFYLHDTRARPQNGYGIGSNVPHRDPDGVERTGSRGCVNTPWWAMQQLYGWARRGDTVAVMDVAAPAPPSVPEIDPPPLPPPGPKPPPPPPFRVSKGYWGFPGYRFE